MAVLQGVRALLKCRTDSSVDSKAAISRVLESLGAKTCSRMSKEVTHIIYQKPQTATLLEKLAQEQDIKQLYDTMMHVRPIWPACKAFMPTPIDTDFAGSFQGKYAAHIVSPLWVRCSAQQHHRAQVYFEPSGMMSSSCGHDENE